jgi:hypothetical protein
MSYTAVAYRLPRLLRRHALAAFADSLPASVRMLDAGAGEGQYAHYFSRRRYCGVDLAVMMGARRP